MTTLTVRHVPAEVLEALKREAEKRGITPGETVIELLRQGLGVGRVRSNGLGRLGGQWTEEEFQEFERAVAPFGETTETQRDMASGRAGREKFEEALSRLSDVEAEEHDRL